MALAGGYQPCNWREPGLTWAAGHFKGRDSKFNGRCGVPTKNRNTLMRMSIVWGGFCLAFFVMLGACSKSTEGDKPPSMEFEGVKVDTPQLTAEFLATSLELQKPVNDAVTKMRYKQYIEAMVGLDEVLKSPGLNDKQKKILTQVIGQLKEVVEKSPPRPN